MVRFTLFALPPCRARPLPHPPRRPAAAGAGAAGAAANLAVLLIMEPAPPLAAVAAGAAPAAMRRAGGVGEAAAVVSLLPTRSRRSRQCSTSRPRSRRGMPPRLPLALKTCCLSSSCQPRRRDSSRPTSLQLSPATRRPGPAAGTTRCSRRCSRRHCSSRL